MIERNRTTSEEAEPDLTDAELELAKAILARGGNKTPGLARKWFDAEKGIAAPLARSAPRLLS